MPPSSCESRSKGFFAISPCKQMELYAPVSALPQLPHSSRASVWASTTAGSMRSDRKGRKNFMLRSEREQKKKVGEL